VSVAAPDLPFALSNGEVILVVVGVSIPIAAVVFAAGARGALRQIGRGPLSVEFEADLPQRAHDPDPETTPAIREQELRQLLEGKAFRQSRRGEQPVDVDRELERLLSESVAAGADPGLRAEVRQLVVARNERRVRNGKRPLDVEAEVDRQLAEFENLGQ
jgi:hypothetical protein